MLLINNKNVNHKKLAVFKQASVSFLLITLKIASFVTPHKSLEGDLAN